LQKVYKTLLKNATAEIEEKKSRFIANVKPVQSEEEALEFIKDLKSKYWDATHNVYAYYIVNDSVIQKFSDDGEPSGTAGLPVLEAIKKSGIQNVVVVVTRYFGGTLLGAAGLVRAYGKCAKAGIDEASIVQKILCFQVAVTAGYQLLGKLQSTMLSEGYYIENVKYEKDVEFSVYVPVDRLESFNYLIYDITNAKAVLETGPKMYITVDEAGKYIGR